ncbi:hypothetical protein [Streptomyces sp. CC228A]|uniref:hypothetical protein n=1 Tax=Streptomyces sp. CC228A TaxID=2898186 RepID=UPI001F39AF96|nr:hypothetical protein [Streptomyces sp. CC228A]
MNINRHVSRVTTLAVGTAAAAAMAVSPASAATNWKEVNTNATWKCEPTMQHSVYPGVGFQGCVVMNAQGDAQVVLVVTNNGPKGVRLGGSIASGFGSSTTCADSVLNPGFTRGCFAPTKHVTPGYVYESRVTVKVNDSVQHGRSLLTARG